MFQSIILQRMGFLLNGGASNRFLANAGKMGIDIAEVDYMVLLHAHCDHADAMRDFFSKNRKSRCAYPIKG